MTEFLTTMAENTDDFWSVIEDSLSLSVQLEDLSLPRILLAMITATICGLIIYWVYRMFYRGVVYSDNFNILVMLVTVVTAFIIMSISVNVVLSLGMVGALSIVRFRSAIKDPLDVGFLFWGVAAGLTAGAGLYFPALIGSVFIAVLYIVLTIVKKERRCYLLVIRYGAEAEDNVNAQLGAIRFRLKNKTQVADKTELTIEIKVKNNDTSQLSRFKAINGVDSVTLLEYNGEYMN
ncbi:MAG: DUF4956 domain-containing protein [Eubacterium sp.]|nr:DUF4956 domain-containing protein [Eubacterium sp.]